MRRRNEATAQGTYNKYALKPKSNKDIDKTAGDIIDRARRATKVKDLFDPVGMINLRIAVRARKPTFEHKGRKFTLDYTGMSRDTPPVPTVTISPVVGFVPMGTRRISDMEEWEG